MCKLIIFDDVVELYKDLGKSCYTARSSHLGLTAYGKNDAQALAKLDKLFQFFARVKRDVLGVEKFQTEISERLQMKKQQTSVPGWTRIKELKHSFVYDPEVANGNDSAV